MDRHVKFGALGVCLIVFALCSGRAAAVAAPELPLSVDVRPLLGERAQGHVGWYGYLVQVKNPTKAGIGGTLRVDEDTGYLLPKGNRNALALSEFSVEAGQTAILELPVHGYRGRSVSVTLEDEEGRTVGRASASHSLSGETILLDLSQPSRIAKAFNARAFALTPGAAPGTSIGTPAQQFAVSVPQVDGRSGELLVPSHAAVYSGATLVLVESEGLEALSDAQQTALAGWVLAGGTLAVALTRDEDRRGDALVRFLGGPVERSTVPEMVTTAITRWVPTESATLGAGSIESLTRNATPVVEAALTGYVGGNLRPSPHGAVASYGMGEVHLLAFNPNRDPFLGDGWVEFQLAGLLERAFARKSFVATPFGSLDTSDWRVQEVRRSLDPNVGNHWVIVVSAFVLLAYAIVAGPVNFQLGTKAGRPLRALVWLPLLSLATFALILALGWISKGGRSKSRHLTLVEAGAGMPRATAVRFRAFYGASTDRLAIVPTERGNVIDVTDAALELGRKLHIEQGGFRVDGFEAQPWQTVVVREDGFIGLGRGIALVDAGNDVSISNRSGKPLAAAVVRRPDGRLFLHRRIEDQASVLASEGIALHASLTTPGVPSALGVDAFESELEAVAPGLADALESWATLTDNTDFWPSGVPVLYAQWVGGEGKLADSGYAIDSDRVVVRVVGFGGTR